METFKNFRQSVSNLKEDDVKGLTETEILFKKALQLYTKYKDISLCQRFFELWLNKFASELT